MDDRAGERGGKGRIGGRYSLRGHGGKGVGKVRRGEGVSEDGEGERGKREIGKFVVEKQCLYLSAEIRC
jgi:hypothetical protein